VEESFAQWMGGKLFKACTYCVTGLQTLTAAPLFFGLSQGAPMTST